MPTCFMIQPFDAGKFDKRFSDIYKPAIEAAGLEAYRVDQDPAVLVPIEAIEKGIRKASVCLADITTDNPNVWYELGYAYAFGIPVVMVCSEERTTKGYPFDIQHRTIVSYVADSTSDFEKLKDSLTKRIRALFENDQNLERITNLSPLAPIEGLSQLETTVLAVIAGSSSLPNKGVTEYSAKNDAEEAGVTNVGFNIAVRRLESKQFIELTEIQDADSYDSYPGMLITDHGWKWIDQNDSIFVLHRAPKDSRFEDDLPF